MASYFIFKKDLTTGYITPICNSWRDDLNEIDRHWFGYMYGFMDGCFEILGGQYVGMRPGSSERSFILHIEGRHEVEYFMLLDDEGRDLIYESCKQPLINPDMTNEEKQQTRDRIGQRIAALRKAAGLTQEELAIRAQLQRTHIGRIEAGRYAVTLETVQAIAQALGMTVDIIDPRLEGLAKLPTK